MTKRLNVLVENCGECPYRTFENGKMWCNNYQRLIPRGLISLPDWCPLPDDVPPPVIEIDKWCEGSLDIYPVKEPEQPFPVGTVIEIDDSLEHRVCNFRSRWVVEQYSQFVFLRAKDREYWPTYSQSLPLSELMELNPKVVEQPQ